MNLKTYGLALIAIGALTGCPDDSTPNSNNDTPQKDMTEKDMSGKDMAADMNKQDMATEDMSKQDMTDMPGKDMPNQDMSADMNNGGEVTYYQHVKPILDQNCVNCHTDGQIGPFKLDSYQVVKPLAASIKESVVNDKTMPPWMPSDQCNELAYKRDLTPKQIDTIAKWVDGGALEGDPNATPEAQPPKDTLTLGSPDLTVDIGTDYKPNPPANKTDDYRCFVVDPQLTEDKYINAFETKPGNPAVVHHMLLYTVPKSKQAQLDQLAAAEPEAPGYTCFGSTKVGDESLLSVWAPGVVPTKFPDGHGIPLPKDNLLVIQVHYNTLNGNGTDRTAIDLHFEDNLTTKLAMLPIVDNNLDIKAGDANATEGATFSLPNLPIQLKLFGVVPHMHALGKKIKVELERAGQTQCLIDIPDWDFNWQGVYLYKNPVTVQGGDTIKLTCVYDNSPERNAAVGNQQPQDVQWGDGTRDEMCLNYAIVQDIR